ncbi:hypothetical protein [Oceanidesulfovibrio marinus]|uniref:hypothetical protein n=1 Tax=Oceanidesulfovibrio marinus TaxID=370038 RepID=UPI0012948235|nr:hypothetical protein [Oceanidesulfovibrio marinus]
MIDRYCLCGHRIHVQFSKRENRWSPTFWSVVKYSGHKRFTCPVCGRKLDIDDLN